MRMHRGFFCTQKTNRRGDHGRPRILHGKIHRRKAKIQLFSFEKSEIRLLACVSKSFSDPSEREPRCGALLTKTDNLNPKLFGISAGDQ